MDAERRYRIGEVADLTGVTIRTLHHYDEIGLLPPEERSEAGYRLYTEADLDRLQRILAYRALGISLEDTEAVLEKEIGDEVAHLERQRELVGRQITRLNAIKQAIEREMEARRMAIKLTAKERFEVFGDLDPTEHAEEVERRWGDTEAHAESRRRASRYSKEEWKRIKAEAAEIEERFAAAMEAGTAADDAEATGLAEEHRAHIDRWFYDCSPAMHEALTEMYVTDQRFTAHYDEIAPGLAIYIHDAAIANAAASG